MAAALDRRLLLVPVSTVDDMLDSPQLDERRFWRGRTRRRRAAGADAGARGAGRHRAPSPAPPGPVGEHTDEVLAEADGDATPDAGGERSSARRLRTAPRRWQG